MGGAVAVVAGFFLVIYFGTLLLQGLLLALQVAIVVGVWLARAIGGLVAAVVMVGWWLVDRQGAGRVWREARTGEVAKPRPAPWARGL